MFTLGTKEIFGTIEIIKITHIHSMYDIISQSKEYMRTSKLPSLGGGFNETNF
jgi:hypothetical protein